MSGCKLPMEVEATIQHQAGEIMQLKQQLTECERERDELRMVAATGAKYVEQLAAVTKDRDELVAALEELVACKDLADKFDSLAQDFYNFATAAVVDEIHAEYLRRKPVAWAAARSALAKLGADKTGEVS